MPEQAPGDLTLEIADSGGRDRGELREPRGHLAPWVAQRERCAAAIIHGARGLVTLSQPIAISNALAYLVGCLSVPATVGQTLDIGGPDVVACVELMRIMSKERGRPAPQGVDAP